MTIIESRRLYTTNNGLRLRLKVNPFSKLTKITSVDEYVHIQVFF